MNNSDLISIVVPVFNEQGNIRPLYQALVAAFDQLSYDLEIIFVDDGSSDASLDVIKQLCHSDHRVKLLSFSRNFGHQAAISAGLEHARGAAVIMMDGDLQHPPSLLPEMIARWKEGFDVVYTIRKGSEGAGLLKRLTSAVFYKLVNRITDTRIIPNAADFRLLDRKVVNCMNSLRERNRFVRGLVTWIGFRQVAIRFVAGQRRSGKTHYPFRKMIGFAIDGVTSFSTFPLRLAAVLGFMAALSGVPYVIWALYARFIAGAFVSGWTSLLVCGLFLGGVQLISLGIIGEYIGRIYEEVKGRPLYIARERVGFDEEVAGQSGFGPAAGSTTLLLDATEPELSEYCDLSARTTSEHT